MTPDEIRALTRMIDRMDYYRLLRIESSAPLMQVRTAYHRARREFHPDTHLRSDAGLRDSVEQIARRITEAYMTLRDTERRAAYDKGLETGELRYTPESAELSREDSTAARGRTPNGRRFYTLAGAEERAGNVEGAISHVKMALTFEPGHAGFEKKLDELKTRQKGKPKA